MAEPVPLSPSTARGVPAAEFPIIADDTFKCVTADQKRRESDLLVNTRERKMRNKRAKPCTFMAQEVYKFTRPSYGYLTRRFWNESIQAPLVPVVKQIPYAVSLWHQIYPVASPADDDARDASRTAVAPEEVMPVQEVLDLQPGEFVQVRSLNEIRSTLDEDGRYRGLYFMPEMEDFCGKKYRVFKKIRSITLETDGEVRKLKSPTVFLEGVFCDGRRHDDCDRSCLLFWREAWLKRVES